MQLAYQGYNSLTEEKEKCNKSFYSANIRKEIVCEDVNAVWRKEQVACGEAKGEWKCTHFNVVIVLLKFPDIDL